MEELYIVKTRKTIIYNVYSLYVLRHNALTNRRAYSLPVVMVVLPMQSIGGNNDGTYTLYMFPLMPRALGLACRPCSGPWQLRLGEY